MRDELVVRSHVATPLVRVADVVCFADHGSESEVECAEDTRMVFTYRGTFARHVGRSDVIANANHVVTFNALEPYTITHPTRGGDASISMHVDADVVEETIPRELLRTGSQWTLCRPEIRIDARAQLALHEIRRALANVNAEPLRVEHMALGLARYVLSGSRTTRTKTAKRAKLVSRVKSLLSAAPLRRWTLAEIAGEIGASPMYLTQTFADLEGVPLYRYQMRLRLAQALEVLDRCDDLTELALSLGFASHSHFTASFRSVYGVPPSAFRPGVVKT
jgi:AraC family transcriptional regulator